MFQLRVTVCGQMGVTMITQTSPLTQVWRVNTAASGLEHEAGEETPVTLWWWGCVREVWAECCLTPGHWSSPVVMVSSLSGRDTQLINSLYTEEVKLSLMICSHWLKELSYWKNWKSLYIILGLHHSYNSECSKVLIYKQSSWESLIQQVGQDSVWLASFSVACHLLSAPVSRSSRSSSSSWCFWRLCVWAASV